MPVLPLMVEPAVNREKRQYCTKRDTARRYGIRESSTLLQSDRSICEAGPANHGSLSSWYFSRFVRYAVLLILT
jgi:hypothetical protein